MNYDVKSIIFTDDKQEIFEDWLSDLCGISQLSEMIINQNNEYNYVSFYLTSLKKI